MKNPAAAKEEHRSEEVRIWDPLVRYGHWVLAVAFLIAYLTEDDLLTVHVWAGYVVGIVILVRLVWGLIGTQHARFRDFLYSPRESLAYLFDMLRGRAKRHLGHSPIGAPMVFALLISLALTTGSGLLVYAYDKHAGPLAGMVAADVPSRSRISGRRHTRCSQISRCSSWCCTSQASGLRVSPIRRTSSVRWSLEGSATMPDGDALARSPRR